MLTRPNKGLARRLNELEKKYDAHFRIVFEAIRELMAEPESKSRRGGFKSCGETLRVSSLSFIWFIWFVWFFWLGFRFGQQDKPNQIDLFLASPASPASLTWSQTSPTRLAVGSLENRACAQARLLKMIR